MFYRIDSKEGAKSAKLSRVLFGLGIRHVGKTTAELRVTNYSALVTLSKASDEELLAIAGIGPVIAASIVDWFSEETNARLFQSLKSLGVRTVRSPEEEPPDHEKAVFRGQSFVITGTLETMGRKEAQAFVRSRGGKVSSSVSSKTSYLVQGKNPGSKAKKAANLGIPVLSEGELKKIGES